MQRCIIWSNKRGQFFLFAAVIISLFLFTSAGIVNHVFTSSEVSSFSEYLDSLVLQADTVLLYRVHQGLDSSVLDNFADDVYLDYSSRYGGGDFVMLYGNSDSLSVYVMGSGEVKIVSGFGEDVLSGSEGLEESDIVIDAGSTSSFVSTSSSRGVLSSLDDSVLIRVMDNEYILRVDSVERVIFIMDETLDGSRYVEVRST